MKASIVIPTYRKLAILRETLASLEGEPVERFEVVVASDGSPDATPDFLRAHRPPFALTPVILEHNVDGVYVLMSSAGSTCNCQPPDVSLLPITTPGTPYVRVTVCVPYTSVAPNVLNACGLSLSSRLVQESTTFRYELD